MQVSSSSLHARLYRSTRRGLLQVWDGKEWFDSRLESSDLCTYVRTLCLYLPLLLLWYTVALIGPPVLLIIVPLLFVGLKGTLIGWGVFLGAIAAFALIAFLACLLEDYRVERRLREYRKQEVEEKEKPPSLIKEWIKAKKSKVCPLVEFTE